MNRRFLAKRDDWGRRVVLQPKEVELASQLLLCVDYASTVGVKLTLNIIYLYLGHLVRVREREELDETVGFPSSRALRGPEGLLLL